MLHSNILETEKTLQSAAKNSRRAWHVIPAQEVNCSAIKVVFLKRGGKKEEKLVALCTYVDENSAAAVDRMTQDSGDRFD